MRVLRVTVLLCALPLLHACEIRGYYYMSLDESMSVTQTGHSLRKVYRQKPMPLAYEIQRENYRLTAAVESFASTPQMIFEVHSQSGMAAAIYLKDNSCEIPASISNPRSPDRLQTLHVFWDGMFEDEYLTCRRVLGMETQPVVEAFTIQVIDVNGDLLGEEVIHYKILQNGFWLRDLTAL